jgi:DNA-binding transcriptional regulator YiaG
MVRARSYPLESLDAGLLVRRRLALSLTQSQLADRLGVTLRALQYWEACERKPRKTVMKLLDRIWEEAGFTTTDLASRKP